MIWPEISLDDFPPRRDDEPSSLRQDIIDELSDHFVCALNRELLKNPDEGLARRRVLERFGDPVNVARQLWLEAMKEKIMSQRMFAGMTGVMVVCSFLVVGLVWSMMKQSERVNLELLDRLAAMEAEPQPALSTETNQRILKQLELLNQKRAVAARPDASALSQVIIQLRGATEGRDPSQRFMGYLKKRGEQSEFVSQVAVASDETDQIDFGQLPAGQYQLNLVAPWAEFYHNYEITVQPGQDLMQTIVCPATATRDVAVEFQIDWQGKLKSGDWYVLCDFRELMTNMTPNQFRLESSRMVEGRPWLSGQFDQAASRGVYLIDRENRVSRCPLDEEGRFQNIDPETLAGKPSVELREGNYKLPVLYLIHKADLNRIAGLHAGFGEIMYVPNVLNHQRDRLFQFTRGKHLQKGVGGIVVFTSLPGAPSVTSLAPTTFLLPFQEKADRAEAGNEQGLNYQLTRANGIEYAKRLSFSAEPDRKNVWKIELPALERLNVPEGVQQRFF